MEQQIAQNELEALNAQIAYVKERIIDVLTQIDDIRLQQNPVIEADYAVKIGYLETMLFESELAMRRAKRKLAIITSLLNTGDPIDAKAIEKQLDAELEDWRRKAEEALAHYHEMLERRAGMTRMSRADSKELKTLYRRICKRLHPDVCDPEDPNAPLFLIAQQAYAAGDLTVLRSLIEVVGDAEEEAEPKSADEAAVQLAMLEAQLAVHEEELGCIMAEFPYAMKEHLANPQWVTMRARELRARCQELEDARAEYEARIKSALEGGGCYE